jgi:hypothetical protein
MTTIIPRNDMQANGTYSEIKDVPKYGTQAPNAAPGQVNVFNPNTGAALEGAGAFNPNNGVKIQQTPIPAEIIGNTKPIDLASTKVNDTTATTALTAKTTAAADPANNPIVDTTASATATPSATKSITDRLKELIGVQGTEGAVTAKLQEEQQLAAKMEARNKINNQIVSTKRAYEEQIKSIRKNFQGTVSGMEAAVNNVTRQGNEDLANLAIIQAGANGDLQTANDIIQTKLDAEFEPIKNEIASYEKLYNLVQNDLSESEKLTVQSNLDQKKAEATNLLNAKSDAYKKAVENNAPASVLKAIGAATSPDEVYESMGKYGVDVEKQLQIKKLRTEIANASAQDAAVNPDVLTGMLNVYKATGVLPTFGNSAKSPLRAQFYAALGKPEGAAIVTDANTNKTIRAGLNTAYKTQQNQLAANETAINTLDQQLTLAQSYRAKVGDSGSPLVNKYKQSLASGVFGDPDTAALNNIVKTASYEFAKILSGAAASISGVTVNSAADAEAMLNGAMAKGQFNEVIGLMQKEANFRLSSQKDTLKRLESDLGNVGNLSSALKETDPLGIFK